MLALACGTSFNRGLMSRLMGTTSEYRLSATMLSPLLMTVHFLFHNITVLALQGMEDDETLLL